MCFCAELALQLEREAAIGPCPIDLEYFKTTRPPLNYMNLSEHKQTKEFLFNGGYLSDFTNSQSVSGVSEAFQNHFLGLIECKFLAQNSVIPYRSYTEGVAKLKWCGHMFSMIGGKMRRNSAQL